MPCLYIYDNGAEQNIINNLFINAIVSNKIFGIFIVVLFVDHYSGKGAEQSVKWLYSQNLI